MVTVWLCAAAVMSALRGLQEKFRQLELDRSQAESSLRSLTTRHDAHDAASGVTRDTDTDSSCLSAAREANVSAHARGETRRYLCRSGLVHVTPLTAASLRVFEVRRSDGVLSEQLPGNWGTTQFILLRPQYKNLTPFYATDYSFPFTLLFIVHCLRHVSYA